MWERAFGGGEGSEGVEVQAEMEGRSFLTVGYVSD